MLRTCRKIREHLQQELHIASCARTALHHAWRAEQLRSIRPFDVHAPDGGSVETPLSGHAHARVEPLLRDAIDLAAAHARSGVAPEAPNTTIDHALRSDILSRQLQGYRQLVARLRSIQHAPVIRMLRIVGSLAFDLSQS